MSSSIVHSFYEKQRFNQWYLWVIIVVATILPSVLILSKIKFEPPFIRVIQSDLPLILLAITLILPTILFAVLHMSTTIDQERISMHYFPLFKKHYLWTDVSSAEVLNYGFVGGWGIRPGTRYGMVYNVAGNRGLWLTFKSGKKVLLGTQKEEELKHYLTSINRFDGV